ncbi:hypothetical protein SAMN04487948_106146 [Halogranum amylolyticum]|uniref:Uncharacterized protein n=1 Tax=Halogranum amylolyticum TaxID=660520 RepID=A0A1H8TCC8_9EURY|nr:hypothetical protein [Halogranum amylolyticum]SEO88158.1 hypothetical protein SAMN04487948_106146 [Halogranum amylolyticum]
MNTFDTTSLGTVLGLVLVAAGELFAAATVATLGVALVGLSLPAGLLVTTWRLLRATDRRVRGRDHFVNVDGVLYPRT